MGYVAVVALSLLVGGGVYLATMRAGQDRPAAVGFDTPFGSDPEGEPEAERPQAPGHGYTYLRVATHGPSWQDRIQGVLGLAILLIVGTAALSFAIYQVGYLINNVIERFFEQ